MNLKRIMVLGALLGVIAVLVWLATQPPTSPSPAPNTSLPAQEQPLATLTRSVSLVEVTPKDTNVPRNPAPPDPLREGDVVTTGADGQADLIFEGNTLVHLEANTSVVIGAKSAKGATLGAVLLAGQAQLTSGKSDGAFSIGTPLGIVALPRDKLAQVSIRFDEGVKVLAGEVNLTSPRASVGQVLMSGQEMKLDGLSVPANSGQVDGLTLDVPVAPPPPLAAKVRPRSGRVFLRRKGAPTWKRLGAEQPLVQGDVVRLGPSASAHVALDDAMGLRLGPKSLFALQGSVAQKELHEATATLSNGPAEVQISSAGVSQKAHLVVDSTQVTVAPTAQAASVEMVPLKHSAKVRVRFGSATLRDGTVIHAGDEATVHNGVVVAGPKDAYPDAPEVRAGVATELYYDKGVPPVRFVLPRNTRDRKAPARRLQWSQSQNFATIDDAEDVAGNSFARDRLAMGRTYFRSVEDRLRVGELRTEPDGAAGCEACRAENIIDDTGSKTVLHYERIPPRVRLRWNQPGGQNSTLYVFGDSDLKKPLLQKDVVENLFELPASLLNPGIYHWYVGRADRPGEPLGARAINTLKVEHEESIDGLMLATPKLGLVTRKARVISRGRVAKGATLTLNGRRVALGEDGSFRVATTLSRGANRFVYRVREAKQNDKIYIRDVTSLN